MAFPMIESRVAGISGFNRIAGTGVRFRTASKITAVVWPPKAGRPVAIS
jgi:hypothetical protein